MTNLVNFTGALKDLKTENMANFHKKGILFKEFLGSEFRLSIVL